MIDLLDRFQKLLAEGQSAAMYHFCNEQGHTTDSLSREELDKTARQIATLLYEQGLEAGDRVLLVYSFSIDVVPALLGCFYAGIIPCPVAPPNPSQLKKELPRFEDLARDTGCKAVLTNEEYARYRMLANLRWPMLTRNTHWRQLTWLKTDNVLPDPLVICHQAAPDDVAFLQYTSGSTSAPKGVMISFRNLMAQLDAIQEHYAIDNSSRLLAWIPYYHDHCLVAGILNIMCRGGVFYLMSPLTFLANPAIWFDVLTRVKATGTAAPDFAFNYAVRKTTSEQRQQWDLSSIDIFQSGGEPVRADSVNRFYAAFAVTGLREDTFSPGYGMAEHVLCISNMVGRCKQISIDRKQYELANRVVPSDAPDSQILVSNGKPLDGVHIAIVDPVSCQRLTGNDVGEIWIDSECKALGYWNKPELNETQFNACLADDKSDHRFLRTGDLGFLFEEELFVAGRIKDTIILRGRNIHPQDVEAIVSIAHESVRPGRSVAFAHVLDGESEHLAVVAETREKYLSEDQARQIANSIRQHITATLAVSCRTLILASPGTISKTTSGKHQRLKARDDFKSGLMDKRILWRDTLPDNEQALPIDAKPEHLTEAIILERLLTQVAAIEARPAQDIDVDAPLNSFALDSLAIMGLVLEMTTWSGREVSHEAFTESGTLRGVACTFMRADKTLASNSTDANVASMTTLAAPASDKHLYPLNPSQAWMFEPDGPAPHGWTIGGMLQTRDPVKIPVLQRALDLVVDHHEALRLRLQQTARGWQQRIVTNCAAQVECVDLAGLSGNSLRNEIERVVESRQQSMNLTDGPAIQLAVLRVDATEVERLLFLVHHIAVDAYSCELVVVDLIRTYEQLLHGQEVTLIKPQVGYWQWMNKLLAMAISDETLSSADNFLNMPAAPRLALDNPDGRNTDGNYTAESFTLSYQQSTELLKRIPNATGLSTAMLLLTSLCCALNEYLGVTTHRFELVHHGRKDAVPDCDLTRTCGWMSINCPVTLELDGAADPITQAKAIKATINSLPRNGLDYSLLAFMHPDPALRQRIRQATRPEMKFMWFGQAQGMIQTLTERYPVSPETVGTSFEKHRAAHYLKYFYGTVHNGCIRLDVGSSSECYRDTTRQALMTLWQKKIEYLINHSS